MLKLTGLVSTLFLLAVNPVLAADAKSAGPDMRCEKLTATTLADFKASLVENCNLNKPFSTSLSKVLNDEIYFYCCHKK